MYRSDTPFFDKETTNFIKGIALIMMFIHHMFTFPNWWIDGISYPTLKILAPYLCSPFKMCVPVFAFLSGYSYYFNPQKTLSYSLKKITDMMISYWVVFIVLSSIAVFLGYQYTLRNFLLEVLALYRPVMIFCWYVYFYYTLMMVLPWVIKCFRSQNIVVDFVIGCVIIPIVSELLSRSFPMYIYPLFSNLSHWLPVVICGYIVAKYALFDKLQSYLCTSQLAHSGVITFVMLIICIVTCMLRKYIPCLYLSIGELSYLNKVFQPLINLDIFYVTFFLFALIYLYRQFNLRIFGGIVREIGRKSMLMWFVSCIFFNVSKQYFQSYLYYPGNPILVLMWGLGLCYLMSLCFEYFVSILIALKNKRIV